jgi:peptide/nickel transport system substrate-binding protein
MHRRTLLRTAAALPALALPGVARSAAATTLRFVPIIDLAFVDPIYSGAFVSRNHGYMVFDTLYGMNTRLEPSPQMVAGHTVSDGGKLWELKLRDGLCWHDGERVLARDCVASIRRWAARDALGDALMKATDELSAADDATIRFRLRRPFPLLPYALGKPAVPACFMMPERLAASDPFKPISDVIGSGPFRFKADERVPGAFNAYERFDRYQPREDGVTDWTAGPKIVHFDRVEWKTMPDAGTAAAAIEAGEEDWQETAPHDLLGVLNSTRGVLTRVLDSFGYVCMMRVNHLQPPFNNPAIRRALLGAVDQAAFMTAVAGTDPAYQATPIGYFCPGSPMASEVGMEVFRGPRDPDKVRRALKEAGYNGEKVVLLVPVDSLAQKPLGDVAAGMLREVGMDVEYVGIDYGSVLTRRNRKTPSAEGGWSAFVVNWQGIDWLNPAGHIGLRGDAGYPGWYASEKMEALRAQWLTAEDLPAQQRICRDIQALAFAEVPYYPLGLYRQPTAYRDTLSGMLSGTAVFWNIRRAG